MNKKALTSIVLSYCVFFILLFSSTQLVLSIPLGETFHLKNSKSINDDDYFNNLDARVESFIQNQDIMFTVEFSGYAFPQNHVKINNKSIKLVFLSDENQYEVETKILDRFELRDLFNEKGVVGINHGFVTRFSPLAMKNGVYNLYIYCYTNQDVIGVFDTGITYEKGYRFFNEHKEIVQTKN